MSGLWVADSSENHQRALPQSKLRNEHLIGMSVPRGLRVRPPPWSPESFLSKWCVTGHCSNPAPAPSKMHWREKQGCVISYLARVMLGLLIKFLPNKCHSIWQFSGSHYPLRQIVRVWIPRAKIVRRSSWISVWFCWDFHVGFFSWSLPQYFLAL